MRVDLEQIKDRVKYFEKQLNIKRCNTKYYQQDCIQLSTRKVEYMYTQRTSTHI